MDIEQRLLVEIRPYEQNAKLLNDKSVEAVANSIHSFGFRKPIVVDADGVIIAGHSCFAAAQKLGHLCRRRIVPPGAVSRRTGIPIQSTG